MLLRQEHRGHRPTPLSDDLNLSTAVHKVEGQKPVFICEVTIGSPSLRANLEGQYFNRFAGGHAEVVHPPSQTQQSGSLGNELVHLRHWLV